MHVYQQTVTFPTLLPTLLVLKTYQLVTILSARGHSKPLPCAKFGVQEMEPNLLGPP